MRCRSASVLAVATWNREISRPEYRERLACDAWEVVVPDLPQCLVKFSAVIERRNQFRVHDVADENDSTIIGVSKSFL